jgi:hypothetical protein
LRYSKTLFLVCVMMGAFILSPQVYASPVSVAISPSSQAVPQGTVASYSVQLSGASPHGVYGLSLSGLIASGVYQFSTNPVSTPSGAGSSTLQMDAGSTPLFCPGIYPFTVTATNATAPPDTGSASGTLTVLQVGPSISVNLATDKPSYRLGDKVTILISVNRPAEGQLTIVPPGGSPSVFNYASYGPTYSMTKTLTATTPIGRWTATFQADDFCAGFSSATAYFDVAPDTYDVSVTLSGVSPQVSSNLQVDNSNQGTIGGSEIKTLSFKVDTTHTVAVDQYIQGDPGVKYFASQNTWTVGSAGSHTFDYQTEYLFTVKTDPDGVAQVTGDGWFNAGASVQTSQAPQTVQGSAGTQYLFKDWEVDGAPQSGNPLTITLDKPHIAVAIYVAQYNLIVDSPGGQGNPQGSGFYDAGSTAQFSVTSPVGFLVQQVFVKWDGDYTGTSPQGSVVMDKPKIVHAVWTTSYFQLEIVAVVIIAIIAVAALLLMRRRQTGPPQSVKPTPPMPSEAGAETGETPSVVSGESVKCNQCGTDVPSGQTFCHNCGADMGTPTQRQT